MKNLTPTGLGDPEPSGKMALFQPPPQVEKTDLAPIEQGQAARPTVKAPPILPRRIRTTLDLTPEALIVLQQVQQQHRLKTGKVLPLWKAVSQVIVAYGSGLKK